ncbi:ladderlectin-like [Mercenaria mercenaria]|uniref:ladderlectin-like n=1 Tax=Mercenaria mercenaria TaxID=6596 RepID=UPI00234F679F|nr:ladderlectin-like [Mercenaria mercenaria]
MRMSLAFFALSFAIAYNEFQEVLSLSRVTPFEGISSLGGNLCPVNYVVFELEESLSGIHCARVCHSYPTCLGVFYQPETLTCFGCSTDNKADFLSTSTSPSLYFRRAGTRTCSKFSCYLLVQTVQIWNAAKEHCALLGGFLADIKSQEEQEFLSKTLLNNSDVPDNIWIGGRNREGGDVFFWLDGTSIGYENWYPGEGSGKKCMMIWDHKWHDRVCNHQASSICEFE